MDLGKERYYLFSGREPGRGSDAVALRLLGTGRERVLVASNTNTYFSLLSPDFIAIRSSMFKANALRPGIRHVRRFPWDLVGDDFDLARQQFEPIKTPPLPIAILIRHALKSLGLDQYGFVLRSRLCFHFRNLVLLIHTLSVSLKERLGSPYFAIS